jgi:histidine triad (HIT) family protein
MTDCIFCKIINKDIPADIIYEDEHFLVFLDIAPINPGHVLLIPKEHYQDFRTASADISASLIALAHKIAPTIMSVVGAHDFNLSTNVGAGAGQVVPHLHWHLIPRSLDDGHKSWRGETYAQGEAQRITEEIVNHLT